MSKNGLVELRKKRSVSPDARRLPDLSLGLPSEPDELMALVEAEATLGELRGELRARPRYIAEGALRRLSFREAAAYLNVTADWIHPCDLSLRAMGTTKSVVSSLRSGGFSLSLPVTFSSDLQVPYNKSAAWASIVDRHVEIGIFLARSLERIWRGTFEYGHSLPYSERLRFPEFDETKDPLDLGRFSELMDAMLTLGDSGDAHPSVWRTHAFGGMWRSQELKTGGFVASAFGRLVLALNTVFFGPEKGPWVLPWLSRLPQRYCRVDAAFDLFLDMPARRKVWFQAVRDAVRDAMATLGALQDVAEFIANHPKFRDTKFRTKLIEAIMRDGVATVGSIARSCNMSKQTALFGLVTLEKEGIVREMTGKVRNRVWSCVF